MSGRLPRSSAASVFAPLPSRCFATSVCPIMEAIISTVTPLSLMASARTPASRNSPTASASFWTVAMTSSSSSSDDASMVATQIVKKSLAARSDGMSSSSVNDSC